MAGADEILADLGIASPVEPAGGSVAVFDDPAPAAAPEPPAPAPTPERPRQPDGKFAPKADAPAEPTEAAEPVEGEEAEPAENPEDAPEPWSFETQTRGEAMRAEITGALYKKGVGVLIPDTPEAQGQMRQLMTRGLRYERVQNQNQELRAQLASGVTRHQLENQAMAGVLKEMLNPDTLVQAAMDPNTFVEKMLLRLEREQLKLERENGANFVDISALSGRSVEDWATEAQDTFEGVLAELAPTLTPDEKQDLEAHIARLAPAYTLQAQNDDPRGRWRRGDKFVDEKALRDLVMREVRRAPSTAPQGKPTASRSVPPAVVAAPPAAGGAARNLAAPRGPAKPKPADAFASKKDVEDFFNI